MYRRIMVPVDGSAASKRALDEALKLARSDDARLRVLNVVDEGMAVLVMPFMGELVDVLKESGADALKEAAAAADRKHVKAECTQRESFGRTVSSVILAEAKKWRADLLVMGTHGRRGINRLLSQLFNSMDPTPFHHKDLDPDAEEFIKSWRVLSAFQSGLANSETLSGGGKLERQGAEGAPC